MKKRLFMTLLCAALLFTACGKEETAQQPEEEVKEEEPLPEEEVDPYEGMAKNPLTGEYIDEAVARRRPIAVMINNHHKALPQSGIAQADVVYEALAEGEITRLVAVFQQFTGDKIGPVRSARDYYAFLAVENDALYIHHGGSDGGYAAVKEYNIDRLDGMNDGTAFWRDEKRMNTAGMYEHSSYISAEGVITSWQENGFRMERPQDAASAFTFAEEPYLLENGTPADEVNVNYSYYQQGQFIYDAARGVYERHQSGMPQIDDQTGETLTYKNVLIRFTNARVIDSVGRRAFDLVGKGEGLYFTNGSYIPVYWEKLGTTASTEWYTLNEDGSRTVLALNPGKTWVCIHTPDGEYSVSPTPVEEAPAEEAAAEE